MNGATREALRAAVDAKRRETVLVDCGETATTSTYRAGCRCQACRDAEAAYRRMRREQRAQRVHTHNANGYTRGCRCDICRDAHNAYNRNRYVPKNVAA